PSRSEKRLEQVREFYRKTGETAASDYSIKVESLVLEGAPPEVIVNTARERKANLIAMGTYGKKKWKVLLMGSVTSRVVVDSPCDVLVVKKPCTECIGKYDSITLPFDGSEFSKKALNRACEMAKIDSAKITVIYVIPRYEEIIEFFMTDSIKNGLFKEAQKIIATAKGIASGHGVSIKTEILEGHIEEKIIETANKLKNNLIIMGTYGWRGINKAIMGSTTERIIINAACPVLVVR
ncbi:MAG: universal stress protein, partial [Nitrospinae bacterium]|nr:universal stress protein [Nitrospinota bacterium]